MNASDSAVAAIAAERARPDLPRRRAVSATGTQAF
jgi:hypothetical protein